MAKYRVRVEGSSTKNDPFGVALYLIEQPSDVGELNGCLTIQQPAFPGRRVAKPTGPSTVVYPRGGWDRVVVTEILEEDADGDEA